MEKYSHAYNFSGHFFFISYLVGLAGCIEDNPMEALGPLLVSAVLANECHLLFHLKCR